MSDAKLNLIILNCSLSMVVPKVFEDLKNILFSFEKKEEKFQNNPT